MRHEIIVNPGDKFGKWTEQIMFKKKNFFLGRYDKKEDAIEARKEAEKELFEPIIKKYSEDKK